MKAGGKSLIREHIQNWLKKQTSWSSPFRNRYEWSKNMSWSWSLKSCCRHSDQSVLPPWYHVVATIYLSVILVWLCVLLDVLPSMNGEPGTDPTGCRAGVSLIMSSQTSEVCLLPKGQSGNVDVPWVRKVQWKIDSDKNHWKEYMSYKISRKR